MEQRHNDRFCTIVLNSEGAECLNRLFIYGLYIANREDIENTSRRICVPLQYGNNTYRFSLSRFSDEEYATYEQWFGPVIEPEIVTRSAVVIYMDEDTIIYIGSLIDEARKHKEEAAKRYGRRTKPVYQSHES